MRAYSALGNLLLIYQHEHHRDLCYVVLMPLTIKSTGAICRLTITFTNVSYLNEDRGKALLQLFAHSFSFLRVDG